MNWLWVAWIVAFFVLETLGLLGVGGMNPLTHYIRGAVPRFGAVIGALIVWFSLHVFAEPYWRKRKDGR